MRKELFFGENGILFGEEQKQSPPILGSTFFASNNCIIDYNSFMLTTVNTKNRKCFPIVFSGKLFKYTTPLNILHVEERIHALLLLTKRVQETCKNGFKSDCSLNNFIEYVIFIHKLELLTDIKSGQQVDCNHLE